jgi:hypothetical protein
MSTRRRRPRGTNEGVSILLGMLLWRQHSEAPFRCRVAMVGRGCADSVARLILFGSRSLWRWLKACANSVARLILFGSRSLWRWFKACAEGK